VMAGFTANLKVITLRLLPLLLSHTAPPIAAGSVSTGAKNNRASAETPIAGCGATNCERRADQPQIALFVPLGYLPVHDSHN
jgi:hypothetical protein